MDGVSYVTHRIDGELGCWTAVEWRPVHLRDAVARVWHFTGKSRPKRWRIWATGGSSRTLALRERDGEKDQCAGCRMRVARPVEDAGDSTPVMAAGHRARSEDCSVIRAANAQA